MANSKQAEKRIRQNSVRNEQNRFHRATLRTSLKKFNDAIEDGNKESSEQLLRDAYELLDRTAKHGVIHSKKADRLKSRLTTRFNKVFA